MPKNKNRPAARSQCQPAHSPRKAPSPQTHVPRSQEADHLLGLAVADVHSALTALYAGKVRRPADLAVVLSCVENNICRAKKLMNSNAVFTTADYQRLREDTPVHLLGGEWEEPIQSV